MATLYHQHPIQGAELVQRFSAIGDHRANALQMGLDKNPNCDLDFALGLVVKAERLQAAKQDEARSVADDHHVRTRDDYYKAFAGWANIHPAWPAVLIKPYEIDAWLGYYLGEIMSCNQVGFRLKEVLSNYSFETVPEWLRKRVNHFSFFCDVSMSMLCKYRWYRMTMS